MMLVARKVALSLAAILPLASACSAATSSAPSQAPSLRAQPSISTTPGTPAETPIAILPGEPWIVYEQAYQDAYGIEGTGILLVRPDARDAHQILTIRAEHPDWSPDGELIAMAAAPAAGVSQIWSVRPDGTDDKHLVTCPGAPCMYVGAPAWSPDGKRMAYVRVLTAPAPANEIDQIELVELGTGATHIVALPPVAGPEMAEYVNPRWSPDGTQIVFTVMRYPTPPTDENILSSSIAVVRADGSEVDAPRILTDPALFGAYPDWSPDGQRIVFNTYPIGSFQDTTKPQNLYTIRPDGNGLTQVTHFGEHDTRAIEPTWTPDGKRIIFVHITRDPNDPWGARRPAFVDVDGSNLSVVQWFGTHPRLRPTP